MIFATLSFDGTREGIKRMLSKLWEGLDHKGRIATIIGFLWALPYNVQFLLDWFNGIFYTREQLEGVIIVNVLAMIWFILPSKIIIEGPKFKIQVED
jgi:hypothetical protein